MTSDERAQIEAAMDRLLAGTPLRSDGKLTIVSAAIEAEIKRYVLTHKHTDLKDRFYAKVKAQDSVPASETALREQVADLRRKLDDMRGERDEYKQAAQALARALNVLTIENDTFRSPLVGGGPRRGRICAADPPPGQWVLPLDDREAGRCLILVCVLGGRHDRGASQRCVGAGDPGFARPPYAAGGGDLLRWHQRPGRGAVRCFDRQP